MKKLIVAFVGLLLATTVQADRAYVLCDPAKSTLCGGLASVYEFDEASDFARTSEVGGVRFLEPDGANVANDTTNKKTGVASLSHTAVANSYIYVPRSTGPSGQFTVSFWIRVTTLPSASTKRVQILSTRDQLGAEGYPRLYLIHDGTSVKVRYEVKQAVSDAVTPTVSSTTAISASTWYMVSFGQMPNATSTLPYQQQIWVSINAGTKVTANITYPDVPTLGDFIVGGWLNTSPTEYGAYQIDQLASWGGTFSPADLTKLYNAGTGKAFPFVD